MLIHYSEKVCDNITFRGELNMTFSKLLNEHVQLFNVSVLIA